MCILHSWLVDRSEVISRDFPTVDWLGLFAFTAEDTGSRPGWGTKNQDPTSCVCVCVCVCVCALSHFGHV